MRENKKQGMKGKEVVILIDSGSSHNFVNSRLVKKWGCIVQNTPIFYVMVADGNKMECSGICKEMVLEVQNYKFKVDLYPLQLSGTDVVWGIQW